jgi:hypothetical protein
MKYDRSLISFFCFLFIGCSGIYAQHSAGITFVRFNSYIGYVIDSAENKQCRCVSFAGDKFIYGSLIQLPDSAVEFRMKASDKEDFYNIPMTKKDVERIASRTPLINEELTKDNDEKKFLVLLAGKSETYTLMDYYNLKYKTIPVSQEMQVQESSFNYNFFNIGIGITNRSGIESYFSLVGDLGAVHNKNVFSARIWYNRFVDFFPVFSSSGTNVTPREHITEIGFLYGRLFPMDRISFTINAGLSYSSGILKGEKLYSSGGGFGWQTETYESKNFSEAGIPLKLEMLLGSRRKSKASFALLADFNTAYVYWGVIVSLRIGNENRPLFAEKKSH